MSAVLTATGATKRFGETQALAGASFELRRGEWLALLGPNGAGKTTLIRSIAGRVLLDAGSLRLLDRPLDGPEGDLARRELGVVPQDLALYPRLTARENLEVFGSLLGLRGKVLRERVAWGLELSALADRAGERIGGFSGGMKWRLNIACGILHRPAVVLLDEPTVGVDPQSRQRIAEMLGGLQEEGASLLLTSHQLDEVQQLCDRIVVVDRGRDIEAGTLDELIDRTVGRARRVSLVLAGPPDEATLPAGAEVEGCEARWRLEDVARDLPPLLGALAEAGVQVRDVAVDAPSLHEVFLHLTGRALRE